MNCQPLSNTGLDANVGLLLIIALACLVAGVALLLMFRSRGKGTAATLLILLTMGAAVTMPPGTSAQAATSDCVTSDNSLTIIQTSTIDNLAPGIAPVAITGLVTNNGTDSTYVTAIDVEITSVTAETGAPAGTCDTSDYHLLNTKMRVERTLSPGNSAAFTGASIGFNNKSTNQDSCQRAIIHLQYTANPQ